MKKIAVVTGSRAEYGLLYSVLKELQKDSQFELQLLVTGTHLSKKFGYTVDQITRDGFQIAAQIPLPLEEDTNLGTVHALAAATSGIGGALARLQPDLLLVLGDRYEILGAVQAALLLRIPVAHIAGGDVTEGAFDESIRHSITKMSHLHFVTNEQSATRVRQLGENLKHVFNVGSPGIDYIRSFKPLSRKELETKLQFRFQKTNALVTFHPITLAEQTPAEQIGALLDGLASFQKGKDFGILFTLPNADPGNKIIRDRILEFVSQHSNAKAFESLGQELYLSAMAATDVVVGNSSSGLYEAPSFRKPTVNIGERQKGRLSAKSVLHCETKASEIAKCIEAALKLDCKSVTNPYGDGHAAEKIVKRLRECKNFQSLILKPFTDT